MSLGQRQSSTQATLTHLFVGALAGGVAALTIAAPSRFQAVATAVIGSAIVGIVSWLSGRLAVRRAAEPLRRLKTFVENIDARSLKTTLSLKEFGEPYVGLAATLNGKLRSLDANIQALGDYAAYVAHELRTPLTIIRLKLERNMETGAAELASALHDEVSRLSHIIEQALLVARAERGRITLRLERVDLGALVTEMVEDFQVLFAETGCLLHWQMVEGFFIEADRRYLRQALNNVFNNALLHGGGNTVVRLRSRGGRVKLTVANNLPVNRQLSPFSLGLGLGWRVVRSLVGAQPGGRCSARRGAKGHAVIIAFPVAREPVASPQGTRDATVSRQTVPAPGLA